MDSNDLNNSPNIMQMTVLCDIGIKLQCKNDDFCFAFGKNYYEPIIDGFLESNVIYDIAKVAGFSLKQRTNHNDKDTTYLSLFFNANLQNESNLKAKYRIIQFFFDTHSTESETQHEAVDSEEPLTIPDFYSKLREYHLNDELHSEINMNLLEDHLIPKLRPYQLNAIKWMYDRENVAKYIATDDVKVVNKLFPDQVFYMDPRNLMLKWSTKNVLLPSGGILADEMGLGKTVEVLALILLNQKKKRKMMDILLDHDYSNICKNVEPKLKCICKKSLPSLKSKRNENELFITCSKCSFDQHQNCVLKHSLGVPKNYICPGCWRNEAIFDSSTTFIVSPASIKMQWKSEIDRHIKKEDFKILIYDGVAESGWINPHDLLEYDVVLTDYNVLTREIYYTNGNNNNRTLRHEKKFLNPVSPLPHVRWYRVVLDEAQMVEGVGNNVTQMVKMLPAVNRWAVTGTPIEKNIGHLYGLVHFLNYEPYNHSNEWQTLLRQFNKGEHVPLVEAIGKIMWRTCKSSVIEQLGIPPQKEIIHFVRMSDMQKIFYKMEHQKCAEAFADKVRNLSVEMVRQLDHRTIKAVMEPLRKLRLDCTNPGVIGKYMQNISRKLLTPEQLQDHLLANTEIECKSQLRTIASSLNGMAGLHIINDDIELAIKKYQGVLELSRSYSEGKICVDSLLQIHALSSLIEILPSSVEERDLKKLIGQYKENTAELEWKYIQNYYSKVKAIELTLKEKQSKINPNIRNFQEGNWWRRIIYVVGNDETAFIYRLYMELRNSGNLDIQSFSSIRSLDLYLMMWWDKVWANRSKLMEAFEKISFFALNLKAQHEMSGERRSLVAKLINEAFECHLKPEFLNEDERANLQKKSTGPKTSCQMCKIQRILNEYECIIFKKTLIESDLQTDTRTEGSWNPVGQEIVLRTIDTYSKRANFDSETTEEGSKFLELLDNIKNEFKEYSQYFVELNYTVAAFDELNMCKVRLTMVTKKEWDELPVKSKNHIIDCHVEANFRELSHQKRFAEMEFARLQGTLKYLKHLSDSKEIDICPVCQHMPEEKYTVLECGHHLCMICFMELRKSCRMTEMLTCPCCRNRQKFQNVHFVSLGAIKQDKDVQVLGSHSTKVFSIIQTILKLKREDENVKILIFSHWIDILWVIARGLAENDIGYRTNNAKFVQNVEEFKKAKSNITCFLLPLKFGSKGLNMIEATHVFLIEPILNPDEEMQAIGRVHRIGQTKETFIHRFIVEETIEENIHLAVQQGDRDKWAPKNVTLSNIWALFQLRDRQKDLITI